jgi:hypothetical protein
MPFVVIWSGEVLTEQFQVPNVWGKQRAFSLTDNSFAYVVFPLQGSPIIKCSVVILSPRSIKKVRSL